jgi:tetratricopeptide (TPR) repeat protein
MMVEERWELLNSYAVGLVIYFDTRGKLDEWESCLRSVLKGGLEINNKKIEAFAHHHLGVVHARQRKWDQAISDFQLVLAVETEDLDARNAGKAYANIGAVHLHSNQYDLALQYFARAEAIFFGLSDTTSLSQVLNFTGIALMGKGQWEDARNYFERALLLKPEIRYRAQVLNNIGTVDRILGKLENSLSFFDEAKKTLEEVGDPNGLAQTYTNLSINYTQLGKWDKAVECFMTAINILAAIDERNTLAQIYSFTLSWSLLS